MAAKQSSFARPESTVFLALAAGLTLAALGWMQAATQRDSAVLARAGEAAARSNETEQRIAAEAATRCAEQQEEEMRRRAYAADMNLAHQAVRENNLGRARELLDRYRPEAGKEDLRGWEWRYLWGLCQSDAMFQLCRLPESRAVISTAIRPGGNWVAIGGDPGSGVEVWDLSARRRIAQLASGEQFAHVAFSPDGTRLAFSTNQWLRVWDCASAESDRRSPARPADCVPLLLRGRPDDHHVPAKHGDTAMAGVQSGDAEIDSGSRRPCVAG